MANREKRVKEEAKKKISIYVNKGSPGTFKNIYIAMREANRYIHLFYKDMRFMNAAKKKKN